MQTNVNISDIIELVAEELSTEATYTGFVVSVADGIAIVEGLLDVQAGELVTFADDIKGIALNLEHDFVGVVVLSDDEAIGEGTTVTRTNNLFSVPTGMSLLGRVLNPLGSPIDGGESLKAASIQYRDVEVKAPGIIERKSVHEPVQTGIKAIDALFPIGRGQRELIIGDRQTGKTAIAIDAIINSLNTHQNSNDVPLFCVYVAVGQKRSSVVSTVEVLKQYGALDHTIVVAATASDYCCITVYSLAMQHVLW